MYGKDCIPMQSRVSSIGSGGRRRLRQSYEPLTLAVWISARVADPVGATLDVLQLV